MSEDFKRLLATLSGYPALWLFSALLHMIDANLNGLAGFFSLITEPSVYGLATFLFVPSLIAVIGFGTRGIRTYWTVLIGAALLIGVWLTIGGSTASDFLGYAVSFSGVTIVSVLFLIPGTVPGVLFLKMSRGKA